MTTKNTSEPISFKNPKAFRKWLEKNMFKKDHVWVHFYKKGFGEGMLSSDAFDEALCLGWSYSLIRRIDEATYKIRFSKRKPKSRWSNKNMERYKQLLKEKRVHPEGKKSYRQRDKEASKNTPAKFTAAQEKQFKKVSHAWDFFCKQNPSYIRYATYWVTNAKREETQQRRLDELIQDSGDLTKLKRVLKAIENLKPKYPPGKTPIEAAKNIGPSSGADLRSIGINTLEKLQDKGWEDTFIELCETHPHRLNMNMLTSLVGAIENQKWTQLDPSLKSECKSFLRSVKKGFV